MDVTERVWPITCPYPNWRQPGMAQAARNTSGRSNWQRAGCGSSGTALILSLCLAGCSSWGNWNSIYREYRTDTNSSGTSVVVDVKQRAILSNSVRDDKGRTQLVVCAEPSPDALSVIASGIGGSLDTGAGKALEIALSSSETGAFIGNRTATIQLLRDMLYRACEMYMAGAIDDGAYLAFQRRYQIMTMGLLAIEQITGTVKPSPLTLAAGSANAAVNASQLKQRRDELARAMGAQTMARAQVADLAQVVADGRKALADAGTEEAKKKAADELKAAEEALAKAKKSQAEVDASVKLLEKEYEEALAPGARVALAGGMPQAPAAPAAAASRPLPGSEVAASVAATAKELVELIVRTAFQQEECFNQARNGFRLSPGCEVHAPTIVEVTAEICRNQLGSAADARACAERAATAFGVPAQAFANLGDSTSPLRRGLDPDRELSANAQKLLRNLVPEPTLASMRYDVFATADQTAQQDSVMAALRVAGATSVRRRSVSAEQCRSTFGITAGRPTVRFDAGDAAETANAQRVTSIVGRALALAPGVVIASPASTPTPLYVSVFLCSAAGG